MTTTLKSSSILITIVLAGTTLGLVLPHPALAGPAALLGGPIELHVTTASLTEPMPSYFAAERGLKQISQTARLQSRRSVIREFQQQDLLMADYVASPGYYHATPGQDFGRINAWAWLTPRRSNLDSDFVAYSP